MKLLGLNSPELFIILVVFLSILGPKRIEKSLLLFKKILKFLLSKEEPIKSETEVDASEASKVKEERIKSETEVDASEASKVKEKSKKAEIKSIKPKKSKVKEEPPKTEANSEESEGNKVKE